MSHAKALRGIATARKLVIALLGWMAVSGCERGDRPPVRPTVSLSATAAAVEEAGNLTVRVMAELDKPTAEGVTVRLNFAGTATRGRDYAVSGDSIVVAPNASSGSVDIDVYRDFDSEGNETVTAVLAEIDG